MNEAKTDWGNVTVKSIKLRGERPDGETISLQVEFENAYLWGPPGRRGPYPEQRPRDRWFLDRFLPHFKGAVGASGPSMPERSTISLLNMRGGELEEIVSRVRAAVAEFNEDVYPALLVEYTAERARLDADQELIERLMGEWMKRTADEPTGPLVIQSIRAARENSSGQIELDVELRKPTFEREPCQGPEPMPNGLEQWLGHHFGRAFTEALGLDATASDALIRFSVGRLELGDSLAKIPAAVAELNESVYPALAVQYSEVQARLDADQQLFDRLTSEWRFAPWARIDQETEQESADEASVETDWRDVTVKSIRFLRERSTDPKLSLFVEFGDACLRAIPLFRIRRERSARDRWFLDRFTRHLSAWLGPSSASDDRSIYGVRREALEAFLGQVPAAVAEFNESYPALLVEYAAEEARLAADQRLIDRVMSDWTRETSDEPEGSLAIQSIRAARELPDGRIDLRVELADPTSAGPGQGPHLEQTARDEWLTCRAKNAFSEAIRSERPHLTWTWVEREALEDFLGRFARRLPKSTSRTPRCLPSTPRSRTDRSDSMRNRSGSTDL